MQHLIIFGLGYVGEALALEMIARGWQVGGTTQDLEKANRLEKQGIQTWTSTQDPTLYEALHQATHLLITSPPVGDLGLETEPKEHLRYFKAQPFFPLLSACTSKKGNSPLRWIGYLSSTSVYGDHEGAWVDEDALPTPNTPEGIRRLCIEGALQGCMACFPTYIFRLAGIYGPGRNVLENIKAGKAKRVLKKGVVFSRIHLTDILQVLATSMEKQDEKWTKKSAHIYNVADDEPSSTADLVEYGCQLLGCPSLPILTPEEADLSPMGRSFYQNSKKICNTKIKREMDIHLVFPNYREGLQALL